MYMMYMQLRADLRGISECSLKGAQEEVPQQQLRNILRVLPECSQENSQDVVLEHEELDKTRCSRTTAISHLNHLQPDDPDVCCTGQII